MKVKAKVAYRDETHRKAVVHYKNLKAVYKKWIEEGDKTMLDYTYDKLIAISETLFFSGAITIERMNYLNKELDKMRGWDF